MRPIMGVKLFGLIASEAHIGLWYRAEGSSAGVLTVAIMRDLVYQSFNLRG
jgi:hypothetical protein